MHHWEMSPSGVVLRGGSKCSRNLLTSLQTMDDSDISSLDILASDVDGHDGYWCLEPRGQRRVGGEDSCRGGGGPSESRRVAQ